MRPPRPHTGWGWLLDSAAAGLRVELGGGAAGPVGAAVVRVLDGGVGGGGRGWGAAEGGRDGGGGGKGHPRWRERGGEAPPERQRRVGGRSAGILFGRG